MKKLLLLPLFLFLFLNIQQAMASDIIFKDTAGRILTLKDLKGYSGKATWEIPSDKSVSRTAVNLHNKARSLGQQGQYDQSIKILGEAIKADPDWPYPRYDLAYTYLLQGKFKEALQNYKLVDQMRPRGFFTAKTAVYTLEQETKGKLPEGLYLSYLSLEWMDQQKKTTIVPQIAEKFPEFAPIWKEVAQLAKDDKAALKAIEKGLSSKPDAETYGILQANKALILHRQGNKEEAIRILGTLALSPDSTLATEKIAKTTLDHLLSNTK